jgi:hypothetical protein
VNSALAKTDAVLAGFDEALLLNEAGHVCEGSVENFFIVRRGEVLTPPVMDDVLEGITRATVIQLASELGYKVVERSIDRTEVYLAEEAFFCGTGFSSRRSRASIIARSAMPMVGPVTKAIRASCSSMSCADVQRVIAPGAGPCSSARGRDEHGVGRGSSAGLRQPPASRLLERRQRRAMLGLRLGQKLA